MAFYGPMGPAGFRRRGRRRGDAGELAGVSIAHRRQLRAERDRVWRRWQGAVEDYPRTEP